MIRIFDYMFNRNRPADITPHLAYRYSGGYRSAPRHPVRATDTVIGG